MPNLIDDKPSPKTLTPVQIVQSAARICQQNREALLLGFLCNEHAEEASELFHDGAGKCFNSFSKFGAIFGNCVDIDAFTQSLFHSELDRSKLNNFLFNRIPFCEHLIRSEKSIKIFQQTNKSDVYKKLIGLESFEKEYPLLAKNRMVILAALIHAQLNVPKNTHDPAFGIKNPEPGADLHLGMEKMGEDLFEVLDDSGYGIDAFAERLYGPVEHKADLLYALEMICFMNEDEEVVYLGNILIDFSNEFDEYATLVEGVVGQLTRSRELIIASFTPDTMQPFIDSLSDEQRTAIFSFSEKLEQLLFTPTVIDPKRKFKHSYDETEPRRFTQLKRNTRSHVPAQEFFLYSRLIECFKGKDVPEGEVDKGLLYKLLQANPELTFHYYHYHEQLAEWYALWKKFQHGTLPSAAAPVEAPEKRPRYEPSNLPKPMSSAAPQGVFGPMPDDKENPSKEERRRLSPKKRAKTDPPTKPLSPKKGQTNKVS